ELAQWGASDAASLPDAPAESRLDSARRLLRQLDALDAADRITAAGRELAALGVHPRLGRLILHGRDTGMLRTAAELAALLSEGDILRGAQGADLALRLEVL